MAKLVLTVDDSKSIREMVRMSLEPLGYDIVEAEDLPAVFTFSTEERAWSAALKDVSPKWVFHEYPGGEHGTKMFEAKPQVERDLLRALARTFEPESEQGK